jgi:hypothetical protein
MRTKGGSWGKQHEYGTLLYDLEADPWQAEAMEDGAVEEQMLGLLRGAMEACEAPEEQYERLGL